jgi:hypothetical protein
VASEHFDDLAKGLTTASTRRRALGIFAGGVAGLWGLRVPFAWAKGKGHGNGPCAHSSDCTRPGDCCCIRPHGPHASHGPHGPKPGVCHNISDCFQDGGFCMGTKKG